MQTATMLAFGNTGIEVPSLVVRTDIENPDSRLVKPILHVPTINSCTMTLSYSIDGGSNWKNFDADLLGKYTFPAAAYTGSKRILLEPMLPGTKIRATSDVGQTASISVFFGL